MTWKTAHRSFYYQGAPEPDDPVLVHAETALLCIDVQNYGMELHEDPQERARWAPFHERMRGTVIPRLQALQQRFRKQGLDVIHARIACQLEDGRDRSLSQKMPGWNNLLMPKDSPGSQIIPELAPAPGEIVVTKDHRQRHHRHQPALIAQQHGHPHPDRDRHLHRSMRLLDGAQPRR